MKASYVTIPLLDEIRSNTSIRWWEHTVTTNSLLQIRNLSHSRVLTAGAEQVAEGFERHLAGSALVEEREGLLVVCGSLIGFVVRHD